MRFGLILLAGLVAGCSSAPKAETPPPPEVTLFTGATHVLTQDEPYFLTNPADNNPPDGTWRSGTEVQVLQVMGAFSQVQSVSGRKAFVATDGLRSLR